MSTLYQRALGIIKQNLQRRLDGGFNSIPFELEKLNMYIPGLQRKNIAILSAASGVGKSKLAKVLYVIQPFEFMRNNPDMDIKLNIFYFALEESKENFIHSIMVYKLYKDHKLVIPIKKLKSITTGEIIEPNIIAKLEGMKEWFEEFDRHIRIIDNIGKPSEMYKKVESYLLTVGHWVMKEKTLNLPTGRTVIKEKDYFVFNHKQHYVQAVIDHISLVENEAGMGLRETMNALANIYAIKLRDKYECSITLVQQQAAASEDKQYNKSGSLVTAKLEPTLNTMGDSKLVARSADEIVALFAPDRYDLAQHRGYDILQLQDHYRSLQILKSRDGEANIRIGLFFDGGSNQFEELPKSKDMTTEDYEYYANRIGKTNNQSNSTNPVRTKVISF